MTAKCLRWATVLLITPCIANAQFLNRLAIESAPNGYNHAYAPDIIYENGIYHVLYCSSGEGHVGNTDSIRYSRSLDGGLTWSKPRHLLKVTDEANERAACDPSVVKHLSDGKYYLYYSGNHPAMSTVIFVARSNVIDGVYEKYIGNGMWSSAPNAKPVPVITPANPQPPSSGEYGAGQTSVYMRANGTIYLWYTDTTEDPAPGARIYRSTGTTPTSFSSPVYTGVANLASVVVRRDRQNARFVMTGILGGHSNNSRVVVRYSANGLSWSGNQVICNASNCSPDHIHNVGVSANHYGNLLPPSLEPIGSLVGFGGQTTLKYTQGTGTIDPEWGRWNLYMSTLDVRNGVLCTPSHPAAYATFSHSTARSEVWPSERAHDGNYQLAYSSALSPVENNVNDEFLAMWAAGAPHSIDVIRLYPRLGAGGYLAFPKEYNLYITSEDNSHWVHLGLFARQPTLYGGHVYPATIQLKNLRVTYGIMIKPTKLGRDDGGHYYFQIGETKWHKWRVCQ